jgi:hypothetical protein
MFEGNGFIVQREVSKGKECDHIYLDDELHNKLKLEQ